MRPIFIIEFCQFGSLFQVTSYTFVNITSLNYSGREERVFKRSMFGIEARNFVDIISCSIYCPSGDDFVKQIADVAECFAVSLKSQ